MLSLNQFMVDVFRTVTVASILINLGFYKHCMAIDPVELGDMYIY